MSLDREVCYRALATRDARFDGRFFTAVSSTGIYCRPICPARTPKVENCTFYESAAAAHEAGFRPCLRCRPEVSPRYSAWQGTWSSVARALALIEDGALDRDDLDGLAARLGMGGRHLRRLFQQHLGASPVAVAQTRRVWLAKQLLDETTLPLAQIAYASGFGSLRRFNDAMRETYGRAPRELRREREAPPTSRAVPAVADVTVKLPVTLPYHWDAIVGFLAARAIPGVEVVQPDLYARTITVDGTQGGTHGIIEVRPMLRDGYLLARIRLTSVSALAAVVQRLRRLFDTGADPDAIRRALSHEPRLNAAFDAFPGLRVPGAWDGFELAVRAVLGQQITVRGATRLAGLLVARHGTPLAEPLRGVHSALSAIFPEPGPLAASGPAVIASLGMPMARAAAIVGVAAAVAREPDLVHVSASLDEAAERLTVLPGIGDWTAQYIAMRALREPDAFPASDLVIRQALADEQGKLPSVAQVTRLAESWRPWRSYATMALWMTHSATRSAAPALEEEV